MAARRIDLPPLPVPPLQQTMQRFLRSAKPLLSEKEFETTRSLAAEFSAPGGVGEKLQKFLEDKAAKSENWLKEWWLTVAYLGCRSPLPVFSNTGSVHPLREFRNTRDQLSHAATAVAGVLDFKRKLYDEDFPVEKMGPHPLDMEQYYQLLGSCRVPGPTRDSRRVLDEARPARHIIVAHNNHFFSVPVYGEQGEVLNQSQILAQLTDVVAQSPHPSPTPVGILTTENRDTWYQNHKALKEADERNRRLLDDIESSLFLLCLDGPRSPVEAAAPDRYTGAAYKMLHGGGLRGNSANRWCDKTMQLVIGRDGELGLPFEHSAGDGYTISVLMEHVEDYCNLGVRAAPPATSRFARPRRLDFNVPEQVKDAIETAQQNIEKLVADLDMHCFSYEHYGKDFIKSQKLSPDSYIQIALQLAFYRLHKTPTAQYESAATRRFKDGRTETIRSCSLESVLFARTMLDPAASDKEKAKALRAAIQAHREYVGYAVSGQGVDRHLLGLRLAAAEVGMEVPQLFLDAGYIRSGHMRLSTSQVPMRCAAFMSFGPVVRDGYGCCYNPHPGRILVSVSAFNSCPETSAVEFCRALGQAFDQMKTALTNAMPQAKI